MTHTHPTTTRYAFGFPAAALAPLQEIAGGDHALAVVDAAMPLPPDAASAFFLVHEEAAPAFVAAVEAQAETLDRYPDAVLYATGETPLDYDVTYFDDVVPAGARDALGSLLAAPRQYRAAELALDLPTTFLERLTRGIATVLASDLPLAPAAQALLAADPAARERFDDAVMARLRLWRELRCPDTATLAAYVRTGAANEEIATHLRDCSFCPAEVATLRGLYAPAVVPVPVSSWLSVRFDQAVTGVAQGAEAVLAGLIGALEAASTAASGALGGVGLARGAQRDAAEHAAIEELRQGNAVTVLVPNDQDMRLRWLPAVQAVVIGNLYTDGERVSAFRVHLRQGHTTRPEWTYTSRGGDVTLPLAALADALAAGADTLTIETKGIDTDA